MYNNIRKPTIFFSIFYRGKYAVVKACSEKKTRKQLVAKLIKYDKDTEKVAKQEFDIMKTLKHDKLLTARDGFIVQKYVVIFMDRWVTLSTY